MSRFHSYPLLLPHNDYLVREWVSVDLVKLVLVVVASSNRHFVVCAQRNALHEIGNSGNKIVSRRSDLDRKALCNQAH